MGRWWLRGLAVAGGVITTLALFSAWCWKLYLDYMQEVEDQQKGLWRE